MKFSLLFLFLAISLITYSQKKLVGCYANNFAISGWFVTHIKLETDSTFEYLFAGDLFYDKAFGTYSFKADTVYLQFYANQRDSIYRTLPDSLGQNKKGTVIFLQRPGQGFRPKKLFFKHGKLYKLYENNKIVKKENNAALQKRKYFLQKHPDHGIFE